MDITPELKERAQALHRDCFVADAHYDLLNLLAAKRLEGGRTDVFRMDYLEKIRAGGVDLLISSIFIDDRHVPEMALRRALDQIACMHEELAQCPDLVLCRSVAEIRAARAAGKIALLLSFEGVEPLGNDLNLLRAFYELGVRGIGIVWSRRNYAADGCFFQPRREGRKGGLTDFGARLADEAERLGMYLDVSHLNDEGFWDLCALTKRPFIASHSNCRALTPVARNLTDEQIAALAQRGGVMGMNACSDFVRLDAGGAGRADPDELAAHGAHVKQVAGAEHLCFGFDFCDEFRVGNNREPKDAVPFYDESWRLTAALLARGFSEDEVRGALGENLLKFLERTIG